VAAVAAGVTVFQATWAFQAPGVWTGALPFTYGWEGMAVLASLLYLALPTAVVAVLAIQHPRRVQLGLCCAVPIAWVSLIFLIWAWKPWRFYGTFPWWGLSRHWIPLVSVALATGWAFWRTHRALSAGTFQDMRST